jgi:hypothetical protein
MFKVPVGNGHIMGCKNYLPGKKGMSLIFNVGKCENCGSAVQEVNAVSVDTKNCKRFNLKLWEGPAPGEGWYSEEVGGEVCENCA